MVNAQTIANAGAAPGGAPVEEGDVQQLFNMDFFQSQSRSIERLIAPHFYSRHFESFREMQALTGLVISGSTTLNFFTFQSNQTSDLDLYVNVLGAEYVSLWLYSAGYKPHFRLDPISFYYIIRRNLQEMLGITLEDVRAAMPLEMRRKMQEMEAPEDDTMPSVYTDTCRYTSPHLLGVIDYRSAKGSRIQLMICVGGVMDCILRFHSTAVMNIATAHACYCLFPKETLRMRLSLAFRSEDSKTVTAHQKYCSRGWTYIYDEVEAETRNVFKAGSWRVDSRQTLVIPLFPPLPNLSRHFDRVYGRTMVDLRYKFAMKGQPLIKHYLPVIPSTSPAQEVSDGED
ncbi:hypothetical protein ONZ45_g15201 [Pleurotus djamor]|nr:hypothetical protein ONZ45_g15201 [Pleurotus djamor]